MRLLGHICRFLAWGPGVAEAPATPAAAVGATAARTLAWGHDITQYQLHSDHDSPSSLPPPSLPPSFDQQKTTNPDIGISQGLFSSLERLARLVDIAYCVGSLPGIVPPFVCASRCSDFPHVTLVTTWDTGALLADSCGYVAVDHAQEAIIVAFRGTYSIANTVVDLSTVPQEYVPYPEPDDGGGDGERCDNCTVHLGFMTSWKVARPLVLPAVAKAARQHPGFRIHLVGHSLGGAVAALAALELRLARGRDVVVTTFGEPRLGNQALADFVDRVFGVDGAPREDSTYRRVTHADDPVPLLPLEEWGYRQHAGEVYIGKVVLPAAPGDVRLCSGDCDPGCSAGGDGDTTWALGRRLKPWQLFFAHRDYFWRLGLCVPGGDPADWGRDKYPPMTETATEGPDEL